MPILYHLIEDWSICRFWYLRDTMYTEGWLYWQNNQIWHTSSFTRFQLLQRIPTHYHWINSHWAHCMFLSGPSGALVNHVATLSAPWHYKERLMVTNKLYEDKIFHCELSSECECHICWWELHYILLFSFWI